MHKLVREFNARDVIFTPYVGQSLLLIGIRPGLSFSIRIVHVSVFFDHIRNYNLAIGIALGVSLPFIL